MKETIDKYTLINKLLQDEYAIIQLNPQKSGVTLPEHLMKDPIVNLKLSKLFAGGMEIKKDRIEANLSFNKQYFLCVIPLNSILSVTSVKNEVTIWTESALPDMAQTDTPPKDKKKPVLKRIK